MGLSPASIDLLSGSHVISVPPISYPGGPLYQGIAPVTTDDEAPKNTTNEQWNLMSVLYTDGQPTGVYWIRMAELNPTYQLVGDTVQLYASGREFDLTPSTGTRVIKVDQNFADTYHAWGVQIGDVVELHDLSPKAFWLNRSFGLVNPLPDLYVYEYFVPVSVKVHRGAATLEGYGFFAHHWGKYTQYAAQADSWNLLYSVGPNVSMILKTCAWSDFSYQDGCMLFFDDMTYDVLGSTPEGFSYDIADGPNCDSFLVNVQTSRGDMAVSMGGVHRLAGSGCYFQTPVFTDVRFSGAMNFKATAFGETARR